MQDESRHPGPSPSEIELLREWYRYNSFVRKKYLSSIFERIPEQERYRDRGASFPSIVDIFMHTIDGYRIWFIYAYHDRLAEYQKRIGNRKYTRDEVEAEEQKVNSYVLDFINALTDADLTRSFVFKEGEEQFRRVRIRDMLWHMVEEELQHRGELNALFWQLGINPPVTGWNPFDEEKETISEDEYHKFNAQSKSTYPDQE